MEDQRRHVLDFDHGDIQMNACTIVGRVWPGR